MSNDFKSWLTEIGLGDFAGVFIQNGVDFDVVHDLDASDLKELGLGVGYRKRFLRAVASLDDASSPPTMADLPSPPRLLPEPPQIQRPIPSPVKPPPPSKFEAPTATKVVNGHAADTSSSDTERRQVAVLFADLTGYTSLSAELDPEELQDLMAEFFSVTDAATEAQGGTVDKHLGDGVMAVFGAPISHGDDTLRAVRAASNIHIGLKAVSEKLGRDLSSHIGIASGEVLAGADTSQYTVIGDAVNLASRLSDIASLRETFLSNEVHQEIANEMLCDEYPNTIIKGLEEPVTVWKVLGQRDEPLQRNILPFVGREAERAQFNSIIEAIPERGAGAAFVLRGEPGIGKTRLATEWLVCARDLGFASHHVLVLDFGSATGTDPLRAIFRSLLGIDNVEDVDSLSRIAQRLLGEPDFESDDEAFVYDLLGLPMSADVQAFYRAVENSARNRRKTELVGRVLESKAGQQPQIILIEDLHWADHLTLDLCATLATRCSSCPALVLMTSRIEGDPFDQSWRSATGNTPIYTIDLRPLSSRETLELAETSGVDQTEAFAAEIDKAGGNPLFLEMMIRSTADSQTDALSGNLRSMVQARIDRLEPIDRKAIQAASVVGQRFDLALLQHLTDEPNYRLEGLLTRSLVHPMGDQYLFAHALVQEGVYASVTHRNAQAMHLKAANWFAERDHLLYAEHLAKAEDERAARAYLDVALRQTEQLRFETASALLHKGVVLATTVKDRLELNKALGDVAMQRNDLETANSAYKTALLTNPSDAEQAHLCLGVASSNRDRSDEAIAEAVEFLDKAEEHNSSLARDDVAVEIGSLRSGVNYSIGKIAEAYQGAKAAVELAENIGTPDLLLRALESFGAANYQFGRFKAVKALARRIIEIAQSEKNVRYEIVGSYQIITGYHYNNEFSQAINASTLPVASGAKFGAIRQACLANEYIARTYLCLGDLERARTHAEESLMIAQSAGIRLREALALIKLAEISIEEGDRETARRLAQKAIDQSNGPYIAPWSLATLALTASDFGQAQEHIRKAEEIMSAQSSSSHNHFHLRKAQIDIALRHGDWSLAERAADHLEVYTGPEPLPWTDFHIKRGRLIAKLGRDEQDEQSAQLMAELGETCKETGMKVQLPRGASIGSGGTTIEKVYRG